MKVLFSTALLSVFFLCSFGQEADTTHDYQESAVKSLSIILDVGFNNLTTNASSIDLDFVNSKAFNVSFFKNISEPNAPVAIKIGLGIGTEGYKFKKATIITHDPDNRFLADPLPQADSVTYRKSKLALNYIDVPVELMFKNNWYYAFKFSLGAKIGYLFDGHFKRKFEINDERVIYKSKEDFGFSRIRYGAYARATISHLGIYGYYSFSDLFQKNKGPELTPFIVGLSYSID